MFDPILLIYYFLNIYFFSFFKSFNKNKAVKHDIHSKMKILIYFIYNDTNLKQYNMCQRKIAFYH